MVSTFALHHLASHCGYRARLLRMPWSLGGTAAAEPRLPRNFSRVDCISIRHRRLRASSALYVHVLLHLRSGVLTSADFCPACAFARALLALRQPDRSPRVRRVTFIPYTRSIYDSVVRMTLGFGRSGSLAHQLSPRMPFVYLGPGLCLQLPSDPPHGGHRCCSARSSCH